MQPKQDSQACQDHMQIRHRKGMSQTVSLKTLILHQNAIYNSIAKYTGGATCYFITWKYVCQLIKYYAILHILVISNAQMQSFAQREMACFLLYTMPVNM